MSDIPRFARIILHVGNLEKATQFYSDLLGIKGTPAGGGRVYFQCGSVIVAILDPSPGGVAPQPIPDIIYFTVQDIQSAFDRAEKLDCLDPQDVHGEPAGKIVQRPWGERSFYVVDPWKNGLCFIEEKTLYTGRR